MAPMLSTLTPPSTSSRISRPVRATMASMRSRARARLLHASSMNDSPPKPRVHRHDQDDVELVEHMIEAVKRRRRVDRQPGLATVLVDEPDGAIDVRGRLRMKADDGSARLGELDGDRGGGGDHQMK